MGQRSVQNDGRVPLSGQTETHLLGSNGPRLPSGHVGMMLSIGTELGNSDAIGGATGRATGGATGVDPGHGNTSGSLLLPLPLPLPLPFPFP